jgi:hypothetical protein
MTGFLHLHTVLSNVQEEIGKLMNKTLKIILAVVGILVLAGAAFYGGMVVGENRAAASAATVPMNLPEGFQPPDGATLPGDVTRQFGARGQGGGAGGIAAQPGMTFGAIASIDGNTLTVTTQAGGVVTVQVTDTTLIEKNASVGVSDLAAGDTVIISGSANDDGSMTARSVQVAPAGRFMGGPPADQPADQ